MTYAYTYERPAIDDQDRELLRRRTEVLHSIGVPHMGDWVIFNDCERRISHIWRYGDKGKVLPIAEWDIQTSNPGGSFYLGNEGYVEFSGSLFTPIKASLMEKTEEFKDATVWFFHHDYARAHNGVYFYTPFRVWKVDANAKDISR